MHSALSVAGLSASEEKSVTTAMSHALIFINLNQNLYETNVTWWVFFVFVAGLSASVEKVSHPKTAMPC